MERDWAKMLASDAYASAKRSTLGAIRKAMEIIKEASTEKEREVFRTVLDDLLGRTSKR